MRFLVDECTGPTVARWLEERGHDVFSVYDDASGIEDAEVLRRAHEEERILITSDKDFGEKSIVSDIHTPGLSFFASATNEVKTRFPCSAACWRNMQIAFRITLL